MTAKQVQIRRDTRTNLNSVTPANSELAHDTTNNRVNIGNGSRVGGFELPNFNDIQTQAFGYASAGGTADVITLTLSPALLAYTAGVGVEFKATATNTGAATINVNSLGAKNIYKINNGSLSALSAGDIVNGGVYRITYDGTQFQIKALDEAESQAGWNLLSVATPSAVSVVEFTSGIDTTYENYALVFRNLLPATSGVDLCMRCRRSGQGTFDTGLADYRWAYTSNGSSSVDTSGSLITVGDTISNTASDGGISGVIMGHGLGTAVRSTLVWSAGALGDTIHGSGMRLTTTALDGLRLYFSSGNITSGKLWLFGLRNSV